MTEFRRPDGMPRFAIGSMLTASLVIVRIAWLPFLAASLGVSLALYLGVTWAYALMAPLVGANEVWLSAVYVILGASAEALLCGFLTGIALAVIETGAADARLAVARVIAVFPQIVLLSLVYSLLTEFGVGHLPLLPLAVASLLVATSTWIYVAVAVREGGGPLRVMRRNLELTRGRRGTIFGLVILLVVAVVAVEILSGLTVGRLLSTASVPPWLAPGLDLAVVNLVEAFGYVVAAVGYAILSFEQGDRTEQEVAQVFD